MKPTPRPVLDEDFARQVRADHPRLVRAVAAYCGSVRDAEDAVQEAYARAWERRAKGERFDDLGAWVVTVALNWERSRFRRLRRAPRHDLPSRNGTAPATDVVDLQRALTALPARQAQCVVMHYLLGYEVRLVAAHLKVSESTVKTALARARAALAPALSEVDDGR